MRTTIDLPQDLLDEAVSLSNMKTKTSVIISALEEYVRRKKVAGIKKYRGKIDLGIDLTVLRNRK